jgi:hypothetical protein
MAKPFVKVCAPTLQIMGSVSPRGKAAGDEIMHKDAANDDRGPERHLVAESF